MRFRVLGLDPAEFDPLFALPEAVRAARQIARVKVHTKPGAPCRISLDDAEPDEDVLLLTYLHQPAATPYRQQGPIFVRQGQAAYDGEALAPAMTRRALSLRAFSAQGMMVGGDLAVGGEIERLIARFFASAETDYIHAHYAKRGCYAARIERV